MQKITVFTICALAVAYVCLGNPMQWAACWGAPLVTHVVYPFAHANVFHLLANILGLYSLYGLNYVRPGLMVASYLVAVAVSFYPQPIVGFSAVLFALMGYWYARLKQPRRAWVGFFVANGVSLCFSNIAVAAHLSAFFIMFVLVKGKDRLDRWMLNHWLRKIGAGKRK